MCRQLYYCKKTIRTALPFCVLILLVILSITSSVLQAGEQKSAGPAIVVLPNVVDMKVKKVNVYGSGFSANSRVTVGVIGVFKGNDLWTDAVIPGKFQSFSAALNMKALKRAKVKPGVYTIMAKGDEGEIATAPLVIKKGKKTKKK